MRALIDTENNVVDVQTTDFEVHPSWTWVDCPDNIKIGFKYDGTNFIDTLTPTAEQLAAKEAFYASKESGNKKLLALGLTQEEATAMTGYKPKE